MRNDAATSFLNRYALSFGRKDALVLRLAGFAEAEVRAEGATVWDSSGRPWLDFGSFGIHLLGHLHPKIVAAANDQLKSMGLSTKVLGNSEALNCAEVLLKHSPNNVDRAILANSGGEAVDIALKVAMAATGRNAIVALKHSYHGKTMGALAVSDALPIGQRAAAALPVSFIDPDVSKLEGLLDNGRFAAVIVEPIQGEGGIRLVNEDFLRMARAICTDHGVLLIFDEIQTGLGRCGGIWRSASAVAPDILIAGKTLGGGLIPISAILFDSSKLNSNKFDPLLLASSFAGGSLASRVAQSVLSIVSEESFLTAVREAGAFALDHLRASVEGSPLVREVRGEGLMIGIEFEEASSTGQVIAEAARQNVLLTFCLHEPRVLRVYPPAVVSAIDILRGLDVIAESVATVESYRKSRGAI